MISQKEIYSERKNKVLDCLAEAEKFLSENDFLKEKESVAAQYSNVENGDFTISVVGEFSAGKSTFLNALMGEKLLPSFSRETTATINFLRHKEKAEPGVSGCVYYNDDTVKKLENIDNKTIEKYVCTRSDVEVATNISHFDLYLDNKFLKDNVTLVDTPGLNGIQEGHTELTQKQIEKSSAGIFLFNAGQPGSKTDFEALQMLRKRVKSIFLVLNRIDEIKYDEHETPEDVINTLKEKYKKDYPDEETIPEFFPVSAYKALLARSKQNLSYHDRSDFDDAEKAKFESESGMREFEDKLWKFLTEGEKGRQILISPVVQLVSILGDVISFLHDQRKILEGTYDAEEIEQRIASIKEASIKLESQIESRESEIYTQILKVEDEFFEEIQSETIQYKNSYLRKIENFSSIEEINPDNISKNINDKFSFIINEAYRNYGRRIEEILALNNSVISKELSDLLKQDKSIKIEDSAELTCFETDLDSFEGKLEEFRNELETLNEELDNKEISAVKIRALSREKKKLEKKMERAEDAKRWFVQNAYVALPSVKSVSKDTIKYQERGGIFGKAADFLVGQKPYVDTETVIDSRERDEQKKVLDAQKAEFDSEIATYRSEISKLGDADSEAADMMIEQIEKRIQRKREQMLEYQKEFVEKIKEKYAEQLRIQKNEISQYIDNKSREFILYSRGIFDDTRDCQIDAMKVLVAAPLNRELENSQNQIEILSKKLEASENERNENLKKVNTQIEILRPIIEKSMDLKEELESIEIDYIREVEL